MMTPPLSRPEPALIPAMRAPRWRRMPPAALALLAHLPALALGLAALLAGAAFTLAVALTAAVAALLAWRMRLPSWWIGINAAFVPLLVLALVARGEHGLDSRWFLAAFGLLALTSMGAALGRVPLYLSSPQAARELAARLPAKARFIDLGCGLGGPLAALARLRPDLELHGIESAPLNWLVARVRLRGRAHVSLGSLWRVPLRDFDAVYAYLSPAPMPRLWAKVQAEMPPGSVFISNTFTVPDVPAPETVELNDLSRARLLIWRHA